MISNINSNYKSICKYFNFTSRLQRNTKLILMTLAECGGKKPHYTTSLYVRLCSCTNENNNQFDKNFNKKIRKLRPDWFLPRSLNTENKKNKLFSLAKNNKNRPSHHYKIYRDFCCYTNKKNKRYDREFDKKIRSIRPDWFLTRSDVAENNKIKIFLLKTKPKRQTKLGNALKNYTSKSSYAYDKKFHEQIKKLKPDWFKSTIKK